jgi:hypothetical protein
MRDLRELLAADILAAIHVHVANLPPEKRTRPPRPPARAEGVVTNLGTSGSALQPQGVIMDKHIPINATVKRPLPPPLRLLATRGGRS